MTNWYGVKEQCAGRYRLLFLWNFYRLFRLKGLKIVLYPIVFFIFLFSKNGRLTSQKYQKILHDYQSKHGISPTKISSFGHIFSYALSLAEKMSAVCDEKCPIRFEVCPDENWTAFQKDMEKGIFLISSHLGNIEALSAFPRQFKQLPAPTVNALMQVNQNSIFHQFIEEKNNNPYFRLYPAEQFDFGQIMELHEKISNGEFILMAGDRVSVQNTKDVISAKLLDNDCMLPSGVFKFAQKIKHPTYAVLLLRTKKGAYRLCLQKLDMSQKVPDIAQNYIAFLEKNLLECPKQWYNFFDFFK